MKYLQHVVFSVVTIAVLAGAADAQKKSIRKPGVKRSASSQTLPPLSVRAAREKVSNQLANVNRFIDVLGPIAQGIESIDSSARSSRLSKGALDRNEANKQKVIAAIRNLRAGLTDLESEFRTKPELQRYLATIRGITTLSAESEDSAIAGRFVASKEPLRMVAQKLTDTLKLIPTSPEL